MIGKGKLVVLLRQGPENQKRHGGRAVPIGTIGRVLAWREGPDDDGIQLMVKWRGCGEPRHTPARDVMLYRS